MKNLPVVWSAFAENELDKIFLYYEENANLKVAKNLIIGIILETEKLSMTSAMGQIEELLVGKNREYRYLIFKNYKVIYYHDIEFHQIRIIDIFDTRQNPIKITRRK